MKSFIRAITIIIVLTFILATSTMAQSSAGVVNEDTFNDDELLAPHSIDPLVQLRTLLSTTNQQYGGGNVLVIPTAQIQPQDMATLMEDMTVMCRIFDKKLAQSNLRRTMPFYGVTLPGRISMGNDSLKAMYVQGYGALFMTTVDFPLSPPPKTEEKEEFEEEDADPVWEQMKQEMFSPGQVARQTAGRQEEKYDARKVRNLKTTLIKSLVHAANIRGLKPDESVILTVTGKAIPETIGMRGLGKYRGNEDPEIIFTEDLVRSSQKVLVIRAKKSYIDALAQNKIDFDEFEQKIQLFSYPSLGENLNRGSSPYFLPSGSTGYSWPTSTPVGITKSTSINRRRSSGRQ